MDINIKQFNVDMAVKTNGIEFEVHDPAGKHRGDLILTKARLEWCEGKVQSGNGVKVSWDDFIKWMNS